MSGQKYFDLSEEIIYLNHAAVSPWPKVTTEAVKAFAEENALRGSKNYLVWMKVESELRERLRQLVHARSSDEIALLKSTSEGLSVIAYGIDWKPGDNVIITNCEFPSNRIVWESLRDSGVEIRYADISHEQPEQAVIKLIDDRTRLVSVSSVQYGTGLYLDLKIIGRHCESREVLFCIDAIQSLGARDFDVRDIRADFVVADGHKWMLGPEGLALFYCRKELISTLRLHQFGWHMVEDIGNFDSHDWQPASTARRFECGSPNMIAIHALHASIGLLLELGIPEIQNRIQYNTQGIIDFLLERREDYEIISPLQPEKRAGIVTFKPLKRDLDELFQSLQDANIQCAQRAGGIRFSPHFYTSENEIAYALSHLEKRTHGIGNKDRTS